MPQSISKSELFKELTEAANRRGVTSQDMWDELVAELVADHAAAGDLGERPPSSVKLELSKMYSGFKLLNGAEKTDVTEQNDAMRDSFHGVDDTP